MYLDMRSISKDQPVGFPDHSGKPQTLDTSESRKSPGLKFGSKFTKSCDLDSNVRSLSYILNSTYLISCGDSNEGGAQGSRTPWSRARNPDQNQSHPTVSVTGGLRELV